MKIKEIEKIDEYLNFARKLKKLRNKKVSDISYSWWPWNSPQKSEKTLGELENKGRIETIQTTVLLKSARILTRVLGT